MADQPTPGEKPTEPVVAAPVVTPTVEVSAPAVETPAPVVAAPAVETPPAVVTPPVDGVPEKYDLKLGDVPVHASLLEKITPIFKESGMTSKNAQALASAFAEHQKAIIPQILERDLNTLKADPQLGGLHLARTQARINDALAAFSTPQERAELTAKGLANNPTLVRFFHRVGASMQDAPQTDAGPQVRAAIPREKKLYGGGDLVTSGKTN